MCFCLMINELRLDLVIVEGAFDMSAIFSAESNSYQDEKYRVADFLTFQSAFNTMSCMYIHLSIDLS